MNEIQAICSSMEKFYSREWLATMSIILASDSPLRDAEKECHLANRPVSWLY